MSKPAGAGRTKTPPVEQGPENVGQVRAEPGKRGASGRSLTNLERLMCYTLDLDDRDFCQRPPTTEEETWLAFHRANPAEVRRLEREIRHERANKAEARRLGHGGEEQPGSREDELNGVLDVQKRATPEQLKAAPQVDGFSFSKGPELPAPKGKKPKGRKTSIQRAAAHAREEIGDALPYPDFGVLLDAKVATAERRNRLDMARLEQAQRAASMVTAARDFYAQVKRTFSRLSDLEKETGPIMVSNTRWREDMRRVVANARAARLNPRDFAAVVSAAGTPELPSKCRPLVELARTIPPYTGGAVKDMAPERGPNAGAWRGSITVEFYVAGFFAGARSPVANHTHTVEVELLASKYLSVLYATGPRSGPAEAAKKMVATLLERSRAAVEAMVGQARAAEDSDTEKN